MVSPRSWLFCPADRPDRLTKAAASADVVVADLEDAIHVERKAPARTSLARWLRENPDTARRVWVRVNNDADLGPDLDVLAGTTIAGTVLPKAELHTLTVLADRVTTPVLPLVETATGVWQVRELAEADRVATLALGEYDLADYLGAADPDQDPAPLVWARARVLTAAAEAGLPPPPAPVSARMDDLTAFTESTRILLRDGFFGRMCIHPQQVDRTHTLMRPDPREITEAREIVLAAGQARERGEAVVVKDGRMIDAPILRRAHRTLELAEK